MRSNTAKVASRTLFSLLVVTATMTVDARDLGLGGIKPTILRSATGVPYTEIRVHKTGQVHMTVTNWGVYGNQLDYTLIDPETGQPAPSCQYPAASGIEYLFQGMLWIGAIVGNDTLVSTGHDGWQHVYEMFPAAAPDGGITKRSSRTTDPAYDPLAIADAEYIAVYYDTLTDAQYVMPNPDDGRPHMPLGLKITQHSYSWDSLSWNEQMYDDFIILKYTIVNIGQDLLENLYVGLRVDSDVWNLSVSSNGFQDDIAGVRSTVDPSDGDSVQIAWTADNDGDPGCASTCWNDTSATGVFGTSLLEYTPIQHPNFNWWVANGDSFLDWGPRTEEGYRDFGTGGLGTPAGDKNKYYILSKPEWDYDQLWSCIDQSALGWLPPPYISSGICRDLADGYDANMLLSFGPSTLNPGDSNEFSQVVALGSNFHQNPRDFVNLFNPYNPVAYYSSLDFSRLIQNVLNARRLYKCMKLHTCESGVVAGDANGSCQVNLADAVFLIQYIFAGGCMPIRSNTGDCNASCEVNIADVVYLIQYIFVDGPAPILGCFE